MPELPEIEVIRISLSSKIIGLKIQKIQILSNKSFIGNPNLMEDQKIIGIWRKAKMLGIELDNDQVLLIHLKMSGQLIFDNGKRLIGGHPTEDMLDKMPNAHTRVIFSFTDGSHLYFNDQRKFGWVKVVEKSKINEQKILEQLGPEPLTKEFTWEVLKQNLLKHPSMPVKVAIMDQSVVSGVGNIYANEACFLAGLDPRNKVSHLSDGQFKKLYYGIVQALKAGIKYGGSTRVNFTNPQGEKGYFLNYANVYEKEDYPCKGCNSKVKKIRLGSRGTYFCPGCQKSI